jgi:predicted dinucleotide-binding enzyme
MNEVFNDYNFNMMKKIGIIGSGDVGKSLANGFIQSGYDVMIGTGNPGKLTEWKNSGFRSD